VKKHGNMFNEKENILLTESSRVVIHHTKRVETRNMCVLYRPTVSKDDKAACDCKRFYTGEDDQLLRVLALLSTEFLRGNGCFILFLMNFTSISQHSL
jgi:hypothetical protein